MHIEGLCSLCNPAMAIMLDDKHAPARKRLRLGFLTILSNKHDLLGLGLSVVLVLK